jgi:hypothetical protein
VSEEAFERLWEFARFQDKMPPQQHTAHARHGRHPSAHDSPSYAFGERRVRSWYGAAGLAIAACLALVFYSLFTYGPATSAKQNAQRLTEQVRSSDSRVAARASRNTSDAGDLIARASRRAAPEQGQEAQEAQEAKVRTARADSTEGTRIADGDLPVPDELRTRAGLFVDYGIVRRLDKLRHLDAILAQPNEAPGGTTSDADSGGHG